VRRPRRTKGAVELATLDVYRFDLYNPNVGPLVPGASRSYWSEWNLWPDKGVSVTAHPFDAWGQNREIAVTHVGMRSYGLANPNASPTQYLNFTLTNTGQDNIVIYWVHIAVFTQ